MDPATQPLTSLARRHYVPEIMMTIHGRSPVVQNRFIPAGARTPRDYPIKPEFGVLVSTCANGDDRVYGFTEARINSELRMVVTFSDFHLRDEELRNWKVCERD